MSSDQINETYFKNINTNEKAYWLGFLYADGFVSKSSNCISICLAKKDEEIIDNFIKCLNINPNRKKYFSRYLKTTNKSYECVEIKIFDENIKNDLCSYGCLPLKTFKLFLPQLDSDELYNAFLCGFYDGDGFERNNVICGGHLEFLNQIKIKFNISYEPKLQINPYGRCYTLCIGWELRNKLLESYPNSLKRKRHFSTGANKFKYGNEVNVISDEDYNIKYNSIDIIELENLVKTHGLEYVASQYNVCAQVIKRLCKLNDIYLPTSEDRHKQLYKFEISKEELEKLINEKPFIQIGKMFNVSDNAIRKRCKKLGLKIPKREPGYWTKKSST